MIKKTKTEKKEGQKSPQKEKETVSSSKPAQQQVHSAEELRSQIKRGVARNVNISGVDLSKEDFRKTAFLNCTFDKCNIDGAIFQGCDLTDTTFLDCKGQADFRWSVNGR